MLERKGRTVLIVTAAGIVTWWARLIAHSKKPPPEGRWREYEPPRAT